MFSQSITRQGGFRHHVLSHIKDQPIHRICHRIMTAWVPCQTTDPHPGLWMQTLVTDRAVKLNLKLHVLVANV